MMKVEIWSDVVCPWCYIGKRRFEDALARFGHRDDVEVEWRAFELDPGAPAIRSGDNVERLAQKYGMSRDQAQAAQERVARVADDEGLTFDFSVAKSGNSFDAHRLIHLAFDRGGARAQDAMKERLFRAYFTEGEPIGDRDTLVRLAVDADLGAVSLTGEDVRAVLDSDAYADAVRSEEREAQGFGISAVPFFVIDRTYGVSGAQPADALLEVLETAWDESHPKAALTPAGRADADACEDDACIV
jgi:predicted DsbA family dithiol-disulfide isomerase